MTWYVLDAAGEVCGPVGAHEWALFREDFERSRVALTMLDTARVSTVFLGMDHRLGGEGPPLLFETMVFGPDPEDFRGRVLPALLHPRAGCCRP